MLLFMFRNRTHLALVPFLLFLASLALIVPAAKKNASAFITWDDCLKQKPEWYGTPEAIRVADNLLYYQYPSGAWDKNMDMAVPLDAAAKAEFEKYKATLKDDHSTIDNGATYTQMRYLARVYNATKIERFKASFNKGFDFLLKAQYPNGGWPQFPFRKGYYSHVTFNDNACVGVLNVLREVAAGQAEFGFVDETRRARAAAAVQKGIECILKCQVRQQGKLTVWCAQHDENTLAPAKARAYELPSLSGAESVGLVRFLMTIENPSPQVREAIEGAVAWFEQVKITGLREERKPAPGTPKGWDKVMVKAPAAPPLWARFYELETNRPFFCSRDGIKRFDVSEISYERRNGYSWYGNGPAELLKKDFPAWRARWGNK